MKRLFILAALLLVIFPIATSSQQSVTFFYVATAVDSTGLESAFSNEAPATVSGAHNVVNLNWVASTSVVAGYNVYRAKVSGGPYTKINTALISSTTFSDTITFPTPPTGFKTTVP